MIIVDASVIVDFLLLDTFRNRIAPRLFAAHERLIAPHLLDVEVAQALRRHVRVNKVSEERGEEAVMDLAGLRLVRYPHYPHLERIWDLRHNLTAYDAAYVALAEALGAPLLTRDSNLASAAGHFAQVEVV
jgi:predicted nucleic acid-binding protein